MILSREHKKYYNSIQNDEYEKFDLLKNQTHINSKRWYNQNSNQLDIKKNYENLYFKNTFNSKNKHDFRKKKH